MYINILQKFQGHCFVHFWRCHDFERRRPPSAVSHQLDASVDKTMAIVWSGVSLGSSCDALYSRFTAGRPRLSNTDMFTGEIVL